MYKFYFLIAAIFLCTPSYAQITEKKNVDRKSSGGGLKPVYFMDNVVVDARAYQHYSKEKILAMPTYKKLQVNNYYQKSYELFVPDGCDYNPQDFDITKYESQRKEDTRVRVSLENACGSYTILHSRKEYTLANEKIMEENSK